MEFKLIVILEEAEGHSCNVTQKWATLHQCLLMLFDSPLNQAGYLEVFIKPTDGRVIKMHREVRIPRTFRRFDQLFCNFLQGCDMPVVQTKDGHARLLDFVSLRFLDQQLKNCKQYRIGNLAPKLRGPNFFPDAVINEQQHKQQVACLIEFGPVNFNILGEGRETEFEVKTINYPGEETYSISRFPLSPAFTCVKLVTAFEKALDIL